MRLGSFSLVSKRPTGRIEKDKSGLTGGLLRDDRQGRLE